MRKSLTEIKQIFILAFPLMLSQFCSIGKEMVDTIMVSNVDKYNLAGMALAMSIYALFRLFYYIIYAKLLVVNL